MKLIVRQRAEHDMAEIGLWYESRSPGTALYFIRCVDAAISLITRHPEIGPVQVGPFRRILVSRFPFGVFYSIEAGTVVVHAVFHNSRDRNRIRQLLESESGEPMQ
jgi:plasmid stabilization system protein ParE